MRIESILKNIDEQGTRRGYSFETFVLNLLKHHLSTQNKELEIGNSLTFFDAIAPDGFDDYREKVCFEVKYDANSLLNKATSSFLSKFLAQLESIPFDARPTTLIIISATSIQDQVKVFVQRVGNSNSKSTCRIVFWGPDELNKLVTKHPAKANEISNNLFALRLEAAVNPAEQDWRKKRDTTVQNLKDSFDRGQLSLFLGAGVSSSAGMPGWGNLLNSLFISYLTQEFDTDKTINISEIPEMVDRLNKVSESSPLMGARYIRKGLTGKTPATDNFVNAITESLYELRNKSFNISSPLIQEIAIMCMPRRTGAKVKSVVNYNFDDLLERQLTTSGISHRSIYTESEAYDPEELPVYHVHGFLPENRKNYNSLEKSTLVFSEEGYHHIYTNAYHWSNLVQLNCLRENNCLMIGLSMTDPNLRRLLDISARSVEQNKHFAFMKRLDLHEFCYEVTNGEQSTIVKNTKGAQKFLDTHHALNEELMLELGVNIIWYENYGEIPKILHTISRTRGS